MLVAATACKERFSKNRRLRANFQKLSGHTKCSHESSFRQRTRYHALQALEAWTMEHRGRDTTRRQVLNIPSCDDAWSNPDMQGFAVRLASKYARLIVHWR
jgi:hypothetical protein